MLKKLFRYPVDVWAALLIVSLFVALVATYFYVDNIWLVLAISIVLIPARLSVMGYNHNHVHAPTFVNPVLNRILEIMMFFQTGTSPYSGVLNHIIGHHANYFSPEKDTLNWRRADGSVMGAQEFVFIAMIEHYVSCFTIGKDRKTLFRNFLVYTTGCFLVLLGLIVHKPLAAVIIFVLPMLGMLYMLKMAAYSHHSGLPMGDDYTASRTNTSWFYNWLTWNAGYHAAHHFKQALHWSLLPAYHAELSPKIPAELQGKGWGEEIARRKAKAA